MSRPYVDFNIVITRLGDEYQACVTCAPAPAVCTTFARPLSELETENFRLKMTRVGNIRRSVSVMKDDARTVGTRLFDAVFRGGVLAALNTKLQSSRFNGAGLRIRLTSPPELADLPWEYLYSEEMSRFLSVSSETPIVRYLELDEQIEPLPVTPPLRVLAMVASPIDYPSLEAEQEYRQLRDALADAERSGLVAIERTKDGSLAALQRSLRRANYHIVHFVGHGRYDERAAEGTLVVEGPDRKAVTIGASKFGALLYDHQTLRLVVLNACEGGRSSPSDPYAGVAQSLVRAHIPAVIAMQADISDGAGTTFAREFYDALADGLAVDAAVGEARKAIFTESDGLEWGTPVLYTGSATTALFQILSAAGNSPVAQTREPEAEVEVKPVPALPERTRPGRPITPQADRENEASLPASRVVLASWLLLGVVFVTNLAETAFETHTVTSNGVLVASAMQWVERGFQVDNPDVVNTFVVRGYSIAYFFVFPLMALAAAILLAVRRPRDFRRLAVALALDYAISLPFFLFFPVPERWAYPDSKAILLSDLWSSRLIEAFRPASALDNCFPSFHTSMTVVIVLCSYLAGVRFRRTMIPLGGMVIVSTLALGIHWLGDVLSGTAAGLISVVLACQWFPLEAQEPGSVDNASTARPGGRRVFRLGGKAGATRMSRA
jgi:membrane-associated phospholipid phosphatase